jgi:hypothetical protein
MHRSTVASPPHRPLGVVLAVLTATLAGSARAQEEVPPSPPPEPAAPSSPDAPSGSAAEPATVITSYGEINLTRPISSAADTTADLRRFVLGLQHRFSPALKFVAELEVEHAISSADDQGEVEIEQAFIERQLGPTWAARAGLILMPMGLLNEHHEPTAYYGVERNFVETAIVPSTWREGGVELVGAFENGLTLQAGLSTSFDAGKWDAASTEGQESPLGSIHQELQLARARDLGGFASLDWRGVPGLLVGGAAFVGGAGQGQSRGSTPVIALWELHARWTPSRFDLSALYARGTISNTAALNAPLVGNPSLVPAAFDGWYLQAAVQAWTHGDLALKPFARLERFNTGRSYADLGPGLTPEARPTETVVTLGVNFDLSPEVVIKADYQRFDVDSSRSRVDLGLGWSF